MNILIIIIGDNNIPNYTLIKFLKHSKKFNFNTIIAIHTQKTLEKVRDLEKLLKLEELLKSKILKVKITEDTIAYFKKVKKEISNFLNSLKNINSIFLDFTGGLKSISIGTFLAVKEFNLREDKKYFSYIYSNKKSEIIIEPLGKFNLEENLSLKEIAAINGFFDLQFNQEDKNFYNKEFAKFLLEKIDHQEKEFFEELWDKNIKVLLKLPWEKSIKDASINIDTNNISKKFLKEFQKFIRGKFLEDYIFDILQEIKKDVLIHEIKQNIKVKKGKEEEFEIDIIATKNNNLYLFSCTTDKTKSKVKQKGFEAKERATQLGGKNAKAILISCISHNQKESLKKDLAEKKGGIDPEIITCEEIKDEKRLKNRLKEIFQ